MAKLSKDAISKRGESYLKENGKDVCLVTEDGSVFLPENERYARTHGATLQAQDRSFTGEIATIKKSSKANKPAKDDDQAPKAAKKASKAKK